MRFFLSYCIKIILKFHFCRKNGIILSLCTQRCYESHNVVMDVITFLETTSGLWILLHDIFHSQTRRHMTNVITYGQLHI